MRPPTKHLGHRARQQAQGALGAFRLVHLLDLATATTYTYVNSTFGAKLAYDILCERVTTMRLLRGARVVPVVKLDERPFRTSFGPRKRPEFTIISWRMIGGGPPAVNGPQTPELAKPDTASRRQRPRRRIRRTGSTRCRKSRCRPPRKNFATKSRGDEHPEHQYAGGRSASRLTGGKYARPVLRH